MGRLSNHNALIIIKIAGANHIAKLEKCTIYGVFWSGVKMGNNNNNNINNNNNLKQININSLGMDSIVEKIENNCEEEYSIMSYKS